MLRRFEPFREAGTAYAGTVAPSRDRPTWVVHDGKRVAKVQYVGTSGYRGYFTIVPFEKGGSQQRTEYLADRAVSAARS